MIPVFDKLQRNKKITLWDQYDWDKISLGLLRRRLRPFLVFSTSAFWNAFVRRAGISGGGFNGDGPFQTSLPRTSRICLISSTEKGRHRNPHLRSKPGNRKLSFNPNPRRKVRRRMATDKQVAYIKSQLRKMKINQMDFLSTCAEEFTSFEEIPFHKVNDILEWIRQKRPTKK